MKEHFVSIVLIYLLVLLQGKYCSSENNNCTRNKELKALISSRLSEEGRMSFGDHAAKYGHHAEKIAITTADGYILTLDHIKGDTNRTVLLVHGNTMSSDCWIIRGRTSLAISLAEQGYDVWAINLRGSTESRKHKFIDPDTDPERFFDFSFYEQGYYDIPATIDYILNDTKQTQLLAVGHSIGTTVFYVMGAERPEYNKKIKALISLAPICFLQNGMRGLALNLAKASPDVIFKNMELYGANQLPWLLEKAICLGPRGYEACVKGILALRFGRNDEGLEAEFLPTLYGHYPAGSSLKTFMHLAQVLKRDKFARFDYGRNKNVKVYDNTEAPEIDLSKVTMKVALFVGKNDNLSSVSDAEHLRDLLPNVIHYQVLPDEKFNHIDFVCGRHMPDNLYPFLIPLIKEYSEITE